MIEPVKIKGLAEFSRNLRKLDSELPKALRLAHNEAGQLIVDYAKPRVPRRTGRAAGTIKTRSTRTETRVQGGSKRAPYYPWLDFGGRVGRSRSVRRPFIKQGRYLYPALGANYDKFVVLLEQKLIEVARQAGIGVD
ncbi:hypothetical protein [Actinophytocola sp. NPDC049390]|uniref:hypothetical protein n=1 Tax=Actinophytocola sp. NPDC049390 TaxID=3363894 RepID=UPI003795C750